VLKHRLLHFEAPTSVFLDIKGREKLGIGFLIQYSAVLRDPLPGTLFEFKSVLHDSARTSEDVGGGHDKTCTPLAKSGPVFSTGRKNSNAATEYVENTVVYPHTSPGLLGV